MQQIRCGLCGRQTLVDPASPGTCPSCGFPLSVPAEDNASGAAPDAAPAAESAPEASPVAALAESAIPSIPAQPITAASGSPLAVGPVVTDPGPLVPLAQAAEPAAAPTGAAFVVGPVVGDPAPATEAPRTASQAEAVEMADYVPPVPEPRTAERDASDTLVAGGEEVNTAQVAAEPETASVLAVQPLAFDASDAAIAAVAEPTAVAEDIYVTHMAEPVAELPVSGAASEAATTAEPEIAAALDAAPVSAVASPPSLADADAAPVEPGMVESVEAEPTAAVAAEPVPTAEAEPVTQPVAPADVTPAVVTAAAANEPETQMATPPAVQQEQAHPLPPQPPMAPPAYPAYPPYPPQPQPPYPGYGPDPRTQPSGPYPYPPQQPPTSPYPYGAQQSPATAPYPQPFPAGPDGQFGQMSPVGQLPPTTRKSRSGLVVAAIIIAVVVLALIIAAIAALLLVVQPTHSAVVTHAPAPVVTTPTASIPAGFKQYQAADGAYSLDVPSAWIQTLPSTTGSGVTFQPSSNGPAFEIVAVAGADSSLTGQQLDDDFFAGAAKSGTISNKQAPTTVEQGGDTWTQESADITGNGVTVHAVVAVSIHGGTAYLVTYVDSSDNFATEDTQYFQPMFTSFQFLR